MHERKYRFVIRSVYLPALKSPFPHSATSEPAALYWNIRGFLRPAPGACGSPRCRRLRGAHARRPARSHCRAQTRWPRRSGRYARARPGEPERVAQSPTRARRPIPMHTGRTGSILIRWPGVSCCGSPDLRAPRPAAGMASGHGAPGAAAASLRRHTAGFAAGRHIASPTVPPGRPRENWPCPCPAGPGHDCCPAVPAPARRPAQTQRRRRRRPECSARRAERRALLHGLHPAGAPRRPLRNPLTCALSFITMTQ